MKKKKSVFQSFGKEKLKDQNVRKEFFEQLRYYESGIFSDIESGYNPAQNILKALGVIEYFSSVDLITESTQMRISMYFENLGRSEMNRDTEGGGNRKRMIRAFLYALGTLAVGVGLVFAMIIGAYYNVKMTIAVMVIGAILSITMLFYHQLF